MKQRGKKHAEHVERIITIILLLIITASFVTTAMWFRVDNLWERALSLIGREYYSWFMRWAVLLCIALTSGFVLGGIKMKIPFTRWWGILFYLTVAVSGVANLISNFTLGTDFRSMMIHLGFSLAFGSTGLAIIAFLLLIGFVRTQKKRFLIILAIHMVVSFGFLATILILDFTAAIQLYVVLFALAVTAYINLARQ